VANTRSKCIGRNNSCIRDAVVDDYCLPCHEVKEDCTVKDIYNPPLSEKEELIKKALVNEEPAEPPGVLDCSLANDPLTW